MQSSSREKLSFMSFKSISNTMTRIRYSYGLCLHSSTKYSSISLGNMFLVVIKVSLTPRKKEVAAQWYFLDIDTYIDPYHPSVFVLEMSSFFLIKYSIPPINFFNHQSSQKISKTIQF